MPEIVLLNPISDPKRISFRVAPWALLHVACGLKKNGFSVSIIDQNVELGWKKRLKEIGHDTLFVGVTAMSGVQIKYGLEMTRAAKEILDVPIVWGGPHATLFPKQTIAHELIDYVVTGEGEEAASDIAMMLKEGRQCDIAGVWQKKDGKISCGNKRGFVRIEDYMNLPYELIDLERYIYSTPYSKRTFELCTSRGCPHACGFCYNLAVNKRKWRAASADKVTSQLQYLAETFKIDGVNFREDNFFVDRTRVEAICKEIIQRGLKLKWHCDARVDYFDNFDDEFIELLKNAGCSQVTFGVESGSKKVLGIMQKGITKEQALRVNMKMRKHKIQCMYHFSFGYPGETSEDAKETVMLARKLLTENPSSGIWKPSVFTPYPGTPLYDISKSLGLKVPEDLKGFADYEWTTSHLPWLGKEEAKKLYATIYLMSGYASKIPMIGRWFKYRFEKLQKQDTKYIPEKIFTDLAEKAIFTYRLALKKMTQMRY
ncbi:MAG: radical SAM protein [Candidatus Woesearchaeota archaeon]